MKKLNNKGYITIEVLIASIVAAVIAVFLIEITVKLVGRTDDAYVDTVLTTDKVLITNQIMNDIDSRGLYDLQYIRSGESDSGLSFTFSDGTVKELYLEKEDDKHRLKYGNPGESYIKNFNISFTQISYDYRIGDYIAINLTLKTAYSDKNYGFSIVIPVEEKYAAVTIKYSDLNGTVIDTIRTYKLYNYDETTEKYSSDIISIKDDSRLSDYDCNGNYRCQGDTIINIGNDKEFRISASGNDECEITIKPSE